MNFAFALTLIAICVTFSACDLNAGVTRGENRFLDVQIHGDTRTNYTIDDGIDMRRTYINLRYTSRGIEYFIPKYELGSNENGLLIEVLAFPTQQLGEHTASLRISRHNFVNSIVITFQITVAANSPE